MEVWYQHQCCDLNMLTQHHQFCTVVEYIWLTIGSSYTNTHAHADCYQPPSLHGGDQLAGNEAKKH